MTGLLLADRDFVGAAILFALAAACYIVVWAAGRAAANEDRRSERLYDLVTFHAIAPRIGGVDHDQCDGCGRTICRCHEAERTSALIVLCGADDVPQGCGHGRSLCTLCAPGECDECLTDLRCQGVLSQYGPYARFTGGAA